MSDQLSDSARQTGFEIHAWLCSLFGKPTNTADSQLYHRLVEDKLKDDRFDEANSPIQKIVPPENPDGILELDLTRIKDSDKLIELRQQKQMPWIRL